MNHVLIVDDNPTNLRVLRAVLRKHGFEVVEASDGAEALEKARQFPPHLIISDLLMPVMDGYTLLRHWKRDEHLKKIPFIVYTATYTEPKDEQLAGDLGADAFMMKSTEPKAFIARLQEVLAKHQRGELAAPRDFPGDEKIQLRKYNEALIRKLEQKMGQLEEANRALAWDIAARKQAEAALRENRALLQAVIDGTTDAVYVKNLQGQYLLFNRSAERFAGKSAADVLGKDVKAVYPMAEALAAMDHDRMAIESGAVQTYEEVMTLASGESRTFLATKGPLFDANGKVIGLFGISRDITARKQTEDALRVREQRYRDLFELESDAIVLVDNETGRILEMNTAGATMYGYSRAELVTMSAGDVSAEPAVTRRFAQETPLLPGSVVHVPLCYHRRKDGTVFPVEITARFFHLEGRPIHLSAVRDITARKQVEAALRESEEKHRLILQTAMDGFWMSDSQGKILEVNEAYCQMIGYTTPELTGMRISDLECRENPGDVLIHNQEIKAQGQLRFETQHRRKDGTVLDVEVSVQYRPVAGGQFVAFLRDITERKREEEKLKQSEHQLKASQQVARLGSWDLDLGTLKLDWSEETFRLFDEAPDKFVPSFDIFARLVHPDDRGSMQASFDRTLASDASPYHVAVRIINASGRQWVMEAFGAVRRGGNGKPLSIYGTAQDITERKQAEEKLLQIMAAVESSSNAISISDLQGRHFYQNKAYTELFGYATAEELQAAGGGAATICDPAVAKALFETILAGKSWSSELKLVTKSGRVFDAFERADAITDQNGRMIGLIGVVTDISERKQAEAALRANEARLRLAMEAAHQGWFELDLRTGQVVTSPEYVRIIGHDPANFTSSFANFMENVHPEDRASIRETLERCVASGQTSTAEFRRKTAAGEWLWFQSTGRVVEFDADGKPLRLCGTHIDITVQVAQRQKFQALLAQTEQDAHIKGELLREVNHRVTNNLSAVLGLMAFETEHLARTKAHVVKPVLDRLGQRIRGLLHVHRLLAQSAWAPVRIDQLADQIIRSALSAASGRKPAAITINAARLKVSPRQAGTLAMVINELATNTVKHAGQTSDAVAIRFEAERNPEGFTLHYRDNGPGYPPEVLANEQSNVGLALIRELVAKTLRGSVVLSNDSGAVVTIRIRQEEETRT